MSAITIRKLPDDAKHRLRMRAAARGTSMEAEARAILIAGLATPVDADLSWIEQLVRLGNEAGGVEVPVVEDVPATEASFDE